MIYVLEDDRSIREFVVYSLENTGMPAKGFGHPRDFWQEMSKALPDLILLDIMLPGEDGLQILKKLRAAQATAKTPVIMLTAKGSEYDKILGLDQGADDYVAKPFGMLELMARIKALLRRTEEASTVMEYTAGTLYVCPAKHIVRADGQEVSLTLKEFELLTLLIANKDIVFSRDQLLNKIWGYGFDGESRTVDVHIRTLRQKLGDSGACIRTVRGVGYRISED